MDDMLREFLSESFANMGIIDLKLIDIADNLNDITTINEIFRIIHTIKGAGGLLGLRRLEALTHAGETCIEQIRYGLPVTDATVTIVVNLFDRIQHLLEQLDAHGFEPQGSDEDLIHQLQMASVEGPVIDATDHAVSSADLQQIRSEDNCSVPDIGWDHSSIPPLIDVEEASDLLNSGENAPTCPAGPDKVRLKESLIRIKVDVIEQLMTMVCRLVLIRNQLLKIIRCRDDGGSDGVLEDTLKHLSSVTSQLQEGVTKTRMQPIGNVWQKMPRVVRLLSNTLSKKINLTMNGADIELDHQVLELIKDPLIHMLRNSSDHGLEMAEERIALGKPEAGSIFLEARHIGGYIIISIADDGCGLNIGKIRQKVLKNGLATVDELNRLSERQIQQFIFLPGFSTADKITNISGRGIGMDVVKDNIESIGGLVEVDSTQGKGTVFTVKIPLTMAIITALIVEAGGQRFAIPQSSICEMIRVCNDSQHPIEIIQDKVVVQLREKLIPLIHLGRAFGLQDIEGAIDSVNDNWLPMNKNEASDFAVIVRVNTQYFGIVVDKLLYTEEIVVKSLPLMLRDVYVFSGNAMLGDGNVVLILDLDGFASSFNLISATKHVSKNIESTDPHDGDEVVPMLVFCAGDCGLKAIPLSLITRLEQIDLAQVDYSADRYLVKYRGVVLPIVFVDGVSLAKNRSKQSILVFGECGRYVGIAIDKIIDIVDQKMDIEVITDHAGVLGLTVIDEKVTEIMDISDYLQHNFSDWFAHCWNDEAWHLPCILLIDEVPFFRNMLSAVLQLNGVFVQTAGSVNAALHFRNEGKIFDVIFIDIDMQDRSCFEFAEAARMDSRWENTPMVALTSNLSPALLQQAREAGFQDCIMKFNRRGLISFLKQARTQAVKAA